jgi:hypothetical protein
LQWITENRELITALTGLGTLLVWVIYLQIFISNYRRQVRATLLVARGPGEGLEARCFLSNMSSGPVYVHSVLVKIETPAKTVICPVTDMLDLEGELPADSRLRTRQGPLASGETRDIGSFGNLIRHARLTASKDSDRGIGRTTVRSIMIEVLGIYGSEDLPIGARRRFVVLVDDSRPRIQGQELETTQIRRRWERRRLIADLERDR